MSAFYGRKVCYTDVDNVTPDNVVAILEKALLTHDSNRREIEYLYGYYKGNQPILGRTKEFRQEICNRIVENRANEIVSFKVGYLMGEPVQYVTRVGNDKQVADAINRINDFVFAEDKAAKDKELADWFTICGTAYRIVVPDVEAEEDESPFKIYTLDPRNTFVVYHSGLGNKPVMGVRYVKRDDGSIVYSVYTDRYYYEILQPGFLSNGGNALKSVVKAEAHIFGDVPIVEYPANAARLGAFEIVLPLLDALNTVSSNRLDGVEQFIQAILVLKGFDLECDEIKALKENGGLNLPPEGEAYYLTQELNQTQTQTLVDYLYQTVLVICGMPNRNGGSSTSDTGSAVIMRDGWSDAEARAKDTELMFKMSEKRFLKIAIRMMDALRGISLRPSAIEIRFTRRNYENIQVKAQVLTTMLSNGMIHPYLAFAHCGLFSDPNLAYAMSMEYVKEHAAELQQELDNIAGAQMLLAKQGVTS